MTTTTPPSPPPVATAETPSREALIAKYSAKYGDYQRYKGFVRNFPPLLKLLIAFVVGVACFVVGTWQFGLGVLVITFALAATCGITGSLLKANLIVVAIEIPLTVIVRVFAHINDPGPTFNVFGWHIPQSALVNIADYLLMVHGFMAILLVVFMTTHMRDFTYALERIGLSATGSFLVLSSFAGATSVTNRLRQVTESQRSRGIDVDGSVTKKAKGVLPLLLPIVISSLTSVDDRTLAMTARGFGAPGDFSRIRRLRPVTVLDWLITIACLALAVVAAGWAL